MMLVTTLANCPKCRFIEKVVFPNTRSLTVLFSVNSSLLLMMGPTCPTQVMVWWSGSAGRVRKMRKYLSLYLSPLLFALLILSQTDDSPELPKFTQPSAENSKLESNVILDRMHRRDGEVLDYRKGHPPFGTAEPGVTYPLCGKPPLREEA